jgi:hypothetical protein
MQPGPEQYTRWSVFARRLRRRSCAAGAAGRWLDGEHAAAAADRKH